MKTLCKLREGEGVGLSKLFFYLLKNCKRRSKTNSIYMSSVDGLIKPLAPMNYKITCMIKIVMG